MKETRASSASEVVMQLDEMEQALIKRRAVAGNPQ